MFICYCYYSVHVKIINLFLPDAMILNYWTQIAFQLCFGAMLSTVFVNSVCIFLQ